MHIAGYDSDGDYVYTKPRPFGAEEWLLMVDLTDQSHERTVIIKNKHSGRFLADFRLRVAVSTIDTRW